MPDKDNSQISADDCKEMGGEVACTGEGKSCV